MDLNEQTFILGLWFTNLSSNTFVGLCDDGGVDRAYRGGDALLTIQREKDNIYVWDVTTRLRFDFNTDNPEDDHKLWKSLRVDVRDSDRFSGSGMEQSEQFMLDFAKQSQAMFASAPGFSEHVVFQDSFVVMGGVDKFFRLIREGKGPDWMQAREPTQEELDSFRATGEFTVSEGSSGGKKKYRPISEMDFPEPSSD